MGRPPQQETPQIVRQIPRAESLDAADAAEEPPNDPPESFFWINPSEPEPGTLRPIRAFVGDTLRFAFRNWRNLIVVSLPALLMLMCAWLVHRWAYEPIFDDGRDTEYGLRVASAGAFHG